MKRLVQPQCKMWSCRNAYLRLMRIERRSACGWLNPRGVLCPRMRDIPTLKNRENAQAAAERPERMNKHAGAADVNMRRPERRSTARSWRSDLKRPLCELSLFSKPYVANSLKSCDVRPIGMKEQVGELAGEWRRKTPPALCHLERRDERKPRFFGNAT